MMENKYYTPDIEDIRVGYECEQLIDYITHNEWKKEIFGKGCWLPEGDVGGIMHWYHTCIINKRLRTAYLTKEQIEVEGFTFKGKCVDDWYEMGIEKAFNTDLHNFSGYKAYNVFLQYGKHDNRLKIRGDFSGGAKMNEGEVLFDGECKSINELRQILKLIHITPFYKD